MSEDIILSGSEETLKPIITLLIAIHQLIENRDVGDIVAAPMPEVVRAEPQSVKVTIFFSPNKEPPFRNQPGSPELKPYCNIPDINLKKLTWANIKLAAGGTNGYNWGRFRATANLSNKRQMQIHAGSEKEAEERILAFADLSKATILTLSITEEKKVGRRAKNKLLYKETTRIYPTYFTVVNNQKILTEAEREQYPPELKVKGKLAGDFRRIKTQKIPLWTIKEPPNVKAIIKEALRVRGSAKDDD
ncbi:MAG: hypothetical protein KME31_08480 [Tolypothrix carrinoi HA7290-LM1]|jgi:hypothetical protein|nr:hypothetical protein [Tolypothrix carrinoi HA7290-LM1]